MQVTDTVITRWALDAKDWLWGTAQGAWNEKMTTSQIVVDAAVGMIPLVGDVTAARDLLAVITRLVNEPERREQTSEWLLLVVLLFALIPVVGGAIKLVGRMALKVTEDATHNQALLRDAVALLNRIGHGNAVAWIKALDLMRYQNDLITAFNRFMNQLIDIMNAIGSRVTWISPTMKQATARWAEQFGQIKQLGCKMIPRALKDLNTRLKTLQQQVYRGEVHEIFLAPGSRHTHFEDEARLQEVTHTAPRVRHGYPQNHYSDYRHVEGWPDLLKNAERDKDTLVITSAPAVEAFSGPLTAVTLKGPKRIYRVLRPKGLDGGKNYKSSPWWTDSMPANAKEWREDYAVLDSFNKNTYFIAYDIPAGKELKAWQGKTAEQFDQDTGQYLPGGGVQLFVGLDTESKSLVDILAINKTNWGETERLYGYNAKTDIVPDVRADHLRPFEIQSKRPPANSPVVAAVRANSNTQTAQGNTP